MRRVTLVCALIIRALSIVVSMPALGAIVGPAGGSFARLVPGPHRSGGCPEGPPDIWPPERYPFWGKGSRSSGDYVPAGVAQAYAFKSSRNGRISSLIAYVSAGSGAKRL